jgi:hypothetical protein
MTRSDIEEVTVVFYRIPSGGCKAKFVGVPDDGSGTFPHDGKGTATFPHRTWEATCKEVAKGLEKLLD